MPGAFTFITEPPGTETPIPGPLQLYFTGFRVVVATRFAVALVQPMVAELRVAWPATKFETGQVARSPADAGILVETTVKLMEVPLMCPTIKLPDVTAYTVFP